MARTTIQHATDDQISDSVIDVVSTATRTDPLDLPPLYEAIDPDALDRLFRRASRTQRVDPRIEFSFAGCDLSIHANGQVVVVPQDSKPRPGAAST